MAPPLLNLQNIQLTFGGTPLMTGADLQVGSGDRIGLVGRNGSGKSTLLKIAAGLVVPDDGERFLQPGIVVQYLPQEPDLSGHASVLDYVESVFSQSEDPYRARLLVEQLGLSGTEDPSHLSGGEARRAALARVLARAPDLLLLDEPTNHLDLPAIEWLEGELAGLSSAIILISHDRRFLERLTRSTVWIDRGKTRTLNRGFKYFEDWRDDVLEQEDLERHKLDRQIVREERWMHGGVTGRRKRNVRRVGELARMRQERSEAIRQTGKVAMAASEGRVSGKLVLEAKGIAKSYDGTPIVGSFDLRVARGDRIGFVGPNGAGKTTLLKLLMGELEPDSGHVRLGSNLEVVTLDQSREQLDPEETLTDAITGGRGDTIAINGKPRHVASYLKDFLFLPEQVRSPLKVLSGGERARVLLARALAKQSNLLVLDEPTNDLDIETLDLLQELISEYAGTVLLVSHDRDFLDRTVTSVVMSEGQGQWVEYAGGYTDMLAQRGKGVEASSADKEERSAGDIGAQSGTSRGGSAQSARKQSKLSFKDKHALDTLPDLMSKLTGEINTLGKELADPALFTSKPDRFAAASERLAAVQAELEAAEEQWLELELKREELEG